MFADVLRPVIRWSRLRYRRGIWRNIRWTHRRPEQL